MSEEKLVVNSEQVFDMLPHVVDIYDKVNFDKFRKELMKKYQGKKKIDYVDPVVDTAKYILRNSPKIKDEFFNIVAIAENRKIDEVKKDSFIKTIGTIKTIFSDPELMTFFKEAM